MSHEFENFVHVILNTRDYEDSASMFRFVVSIQGGFMLSCRLEIWLKFADDLVNLSFNSWRNGEFWKDGDFGI